MSFTFPADRFYCGSVPETAETFHPGEYLAAELAFADMGQAELAREINHSRSHVNDIIRGRKSITPAMAIAFERVLDVSAGTWVALQARWDLAQARKASK